MATGPDLRIGDADREAAAGRLREHTRRAGGPWGSSTSASTPCSRQPRSASSARSPATFRPSRHPRHRCRLPLPRSPGTGQARTPAGLAGTAGHDPCHHAALTAWLLVFDLHLGMFPWPGKLAIFLVIFAVVRGLMRAFGTSAGAAGTWAAGGTGAGGSRGLVQGWEPARHDEAAERGHARLARLPPAPAGPPSRAALLHSRR